MRTLQCSLVIAVIALLATPALAADAAAGKATFDTLCATCHGTSGKGDGPTAAALNPPARNFTDKVWQAKVTDDHIKKVITQGGAANGLSPMMPPFGHLKGAELDNLVAYIRSFGK